jgi:hypothetical protein|tara:strand:- start:770 stop:1090 length:321 start_codon:yes stop_codon:yes gene_type:complete
MNKYTVKTDDKIVEQVIEKIDQRSLIGQKKYGATMMGEIKNEVKDLDRFLIDVQEEIMDALLYIQAARVCLRDEIEEAMLNRAELVSEYDFNTEIANMDVNEEEEL